MNMQISSPQSAEKSRIRVEIDSHIRDYLSKGGKIEVLHQNPSDVRKSASKGWFDTDDIGL